MKYVKPLTEAEQITLREAWKEGPTARVRQRAHALYLSGQRFRIPELVSIFKVNRDNEVFHAAVESTVYSARVVAAIEAFIAWRDSETPTVLVLDNASIHTSAEVLKRRDAWLSQGVILFYLPAYSPELNLIEIFWRKLKYEWLPFSAYLSFAALKQAIAEIFDNVGGKYQITFV